MKNLDLKTFEFAGVTIDCPVEDGHRMMPVKTICDIIDVQFKTQDSWLKGHNYFNQLYRLAGVVAADKKVREMNCLSVFDVLSWLSSITGNNRRPGSIEKQYAFMAWLREEMLAMYKLIEVFQVENEYELQLIQQKSDLLDQQSEMATQISQIKKQIKNIDNSLHEVREKRFTGQTAIPFPGVASAASDDA
jgi:hypothetical protein